MTDSTRYRPAFLKSLSFRLLLLTVFFVMLAEFMIWAPSVSRFRKVYLEETIAKAHLSMVAIEKMPDKPLDKKLEEALLFHTEAYAIVLNRPDKRLLMVSADMPPKVDQTIDIAKGGFFSYIRDAFLCLTETRHRVLRVIGMPPRDSEVTVEVLIDEAPMREAMWWYSGRIFNLSIVISLFTAGLVYVSLQLLLVKPMRHITESMRRFRDAPEDGARVITASARADEVGITERELAVMQAELRAALRQKTRLATLGAAVAKINHDLRNSLATAMLASDRLADIDDPEVKRVVPRLYQSIDRAVNLCSQTLNFAGGTDAPITRRRFRLKDLVDEAETAVKADAAGENSVQWENAVASEIEVAADRQQLFRVLSNLGRNAVEAGARKVRVSAASEDGWICIDVADDGPGLPPAALKNLFQPFVGSAKNGGTGLGLAIVRDVARAHGGDVMLVEGQGDGAGKNTGTIFRLKLPAGQESAA
jgi:signal transduction histidine kinase